MKSNLQSLILAVPKGNMIDISTYIIIEYDTKSMSKLGLRDMALNLYPVTFCLLLQRYYVAVSQN